VIAYLEGRLAEKKPTTAVVDVKGVGYSVNIPLSSFDKLPDVGSAVKLFTCTYVREDAFQLFGFATTPEKELFELLISVNGVGPKSALGILSSISVQDFQASILEENLDMLTRISGVGNKTAQRLIVELKEKIAKSFVPAEDKKSTSDQKSEEAVLALVSLGYNKYEARKIVDQVLEKDKKLSLEELLKKALNFNPNSKSKAQPSKTL
jgi:Holliday junction DNA helicase RuvA